MYGPCTVHVVSQSLYLLCYMQVALGAKRNRE